MNDDEPLKCLRCGAEFGFDELGAVITTPDDRCYIRCPVCSACNELETEPQPGAGNQPRTRIARWFESE